MSKREIEYPYTYRWGNNPVRAERKGQRCKIVAGPRSLHTVMLEFEDGFRMTTSLNAVRKAERT